ncbi:unnamed protein product [Nippostrongylus brasiliensis]|uniref:Par3_HAL_N_term domain-containing protein n=1 Tax=Nippostrongylus brasiliensis TaxID=27835 RepID=A0A0N4YXG3_NIPBR|nr:unnamed protein product [Nippostrongylus brasiliensis]
MECDIRIQRMQCISDEGILDMDDRIIDVFDDIRDQVLVTQLDSDVGAPKRSCQFPRCCFWIGFDRELQFAIIDDRRSSFPLSTFKACIS